MTRKAMKKVITYGTYDLLHYGHVRLLERAKALGDYLIVGVTSDDFDKSRGKINVQQSLTERIEAVRKTGLADQIIVEEYEGQKIDDIRRFGVDIFTVGSDWVGKFDYLNAFCNVVYLDRTQGISSTQLRSDHAALRLGVIGDSAYLRKVRDEVAFVNGLELAAIATRNAALREEFASAGVHGADSEQSLFDACDAVYIRADCARHAQLVRAALQAGRHVLCESPLTLSEHESEELFGLADARGLILMEALKTAFSTAFSRMVLLIQAGKIGDVVSVDAVCTSMQHRDDAFEWPCIYEWGPTALLPIFRILGADYERCSIVSRDFFGRGQDGFAKMDFVFPHATACARVGNAVKSEGDLVVTGTKGYIYVPAPWWKTDYFEVRYENPADNRRYFYALEGEGIRNELVSFVKAIETGNPTTGRIERDVTLAIVNVMREYAGGNKLVLGSRQ